MPREYKPDKWVILKITKNDQKDYVMYKVLGSWYGGYLGANSWRLNSGIAKIDKKDDFLHYYGDSGSVYICHVDMYGMSAHTESVFSSYIAKLSELGVNIHILSEDDALNLHIEIKDSKNGDV